VETLAPSGAVLARSVYTRDATGRVASASETGGRAVTYTYDATYRLTAEAITDPAGGDRRIDYTYDPVGNRLTRVDSVGGSAAYTYDANDRLMRVVEAGVTTDFTYDANGNVLTRLEGGRLTRYDWTAGGLLRRVTDVAAATVVEYRYDPSGNRAAQVVNGAETRYLVDVNREHPQVLEEYTATGVATADYVTGLELISQSAGGARTYFGRDGGGNTRLLTTAAGAVTATYTYDAYGRTLAATGGGTAFQYRGEQRDPATGLDFLRARYLDVNLGRFLSVDPYEGEPARPYTRTDYIYANADPVNGRDPSGRNTTSEQITVAGVLNTLSVTLTVGVIGYKVYASYKAGELSAIKFLTIVGYELAITYAGGAVAKGLGLAAGVLGAGLKPFLSQARNLPGFGNIVKLGVNTPAVRRAVAALGFAASQRASAPATAVNMVEVARTLPAVLETTARGKRTLTVFVNTAEGLATVNRFAAELAGRYTTVVVSSTVQGALSRGLSSTAGVAFDAFANAAMLEAAVARLLAFAGGNTGLALLGE
jgi:RHS repeat-associated protein